MAEAAIAPEDLLAMGNLLGLGGGTLRVVWSTAAAFTLGR